MAKRKRIKNPSSNAGSKLLVAVNLSRGVGVVNEIILSASQTVWIVDVNPLGTIAAIAVSQTPVCNYMI